jgi:hypothetical protein
MTLALLLGVLILTVGALPAFADEEEIIEIVDEVDEAPPPKAPEPPAPQPVAPPPPVAPAETPAPPPVVADDAGPAIVAPPAVQNPCCPQRKPIYCSPCAPRGRRAPCTPGRYYGGCCYPGPIFDFGG